MNKQILVSLAMILTTVAPSIAQPRPDGMDDNRKRTKTVWQQYVAAGSKAAREGDPDKAKRYYIGALAELEKKPGKPHSPLTSYTSKLEQGLLASYPHKWTTDPEKPEANLPLQEEQVNVFGRLAKISQNYDAPMDLTKPMIQQSYQKAVTDLEKTKTAIKKKKESGGSDK